MLPYLGRQRRQSFGRRNPLAPFGLAHHGHNALVESVQTLPHHRRNRHGMDPVCLKYATPDEETPYPEQHVDAFVGTFVDSYKKST